MLKKLKYVILIKNGDNMIDFKKLGFGITNILIYVFLSEILTYILGEFKFVQNIWFLNFYLLLAPLMVAILLILINKDLFKDKFKDIKEHKKEYLNLAVKYYICGLLSMITASLIISLFGSGISQNEVDNRALLEVMPIYSFVSMVILAPISEEISFRGSFKNVGDNKFIFLIITSFLFGLIHVVFNGDFINMLPYAALGFFLGKLYYETDNLLMSIFVHGFHNLLCILIILGGSLWENYLYV